MKKHLELTDSEVFLSIKKRKIVLGGNKKLKIYGLLNCKSGKRMKRENRVFFSNEKEAVELGYRPCGHCLSENITNGKSQKYIITSNKRKKMNLLLHKNKK